jgi:hypothetical protein
MTVAAWTSEKEKNMKNGLSHLRPASDDDAQQINTLTRRAFGASGEATEKPPELAPLTTVLENGCGEIEMACLGRLVTFGAFTLVEDPKTFDKRTTAERLKLFMQEAEERLRRSGAAPAMMVLVPFPLAAYGELLKAMGFVSVQAVVPFWKYLSAPTETETSVRPEKFS